MRMYSSTHTGTQSAADQKEQATVYTPKKAHFVFLRSVRRLLVTSNVVPTSQIFVTLMMEALRSCETSDLITTRRNIPEGAIIPSRRRENLKSYLENRMFRKWICFLPQVGEEHTYCLRSLRKS
jgi:hypothetical protein